MSNATSFANVDTSSGSPVTVSVPPTIALSTNVIEVALIEEPSSDKVPDNVVVPVTFKLPSVVFDATFIVWNDVDPSTPILMVLFNAVVPTVIDSPVPGVPLIVALPPIPEC